MDTALRILKGSLPCLLLAAIPVWRISFRAPLPRCDRLMLLLLLYAAYALVFLCLHVGLRILRHLQRRRGRGEPGSLPGPAGFVWEYFLLAGLLLSNALHFLFGYKKIAFTQQTWLMARGPLGQLLILAAGWTVLFLLFRLVDRRWPEAFGSALARPSTIALILAVAFSCIVLPGPHQRVTAAADPAFSPGRLADPAVAPAPHRPLILVGLDGVDWL